MTHSVPLKMALLLASVFALSPLAVDMYLPVIPVIAGDFSAPVQDVAITVSLYILGISLGQFVGGPVSDYWGRRPVLFVGLAVFGLASLVLATAQSLEVFWVARLVQAVGGGFAAVVVPALIRDTTEGQAAAKLFALIALITIFAPAIAPALGTAVFHLSGWRMVFFALAAYAGVVLMLTWRGVESRPSTAAPAGGESLLHRYRYVLSHGTAMRYVLTQGLTFSVMMTFLVNSSLVYIEGYGVSETTFSALFAANIITMAMGNRINNHLLNRLSSAQILYGAIAIQLAACLLLVMITGFQPPLWVVVPVIMLSIGALGGVMGNTQACCLQFFPHHAGVASALMGSAQFLIGAIVSGISAQFHSEAFWPMSVTMLVASALAFTAVPSPSRFARQVALEGGAQ
ncbi:multidrug effflux MFS transporter [Spongiibacter nanhainus]|uniref:Bcr/CflA family efflux transporter n=1 Tax=Spongiibacter nanhainus TaxID=2794344 RepID=A0A7T4R0E9_9GAMM|nr:multidrug effflux MFS transporter [Spongiibacter nanhainus]QQD18131.1 multidrug effflux MFS transporter [Spongiibacter nanhainus]